MAILSILFKKKCQANRCHKMFSINWEGRRLCANRSTAISLPKNGGCFII